MLSKNKLKERFPELWEKLRYYRWLISYIYTFLLVVFLYPIYRIRKRRIGYLHTNIIGHLALHTKTFFELVENTEYFLDIKTIKVIRERTSANEYLLNKFLDVKPSKIKFKKSSRFLEPYGRINFDSLVDKYKFASKVIIDIERNVMTLKQGNTNTHFQSFTESRILDSNYSGLVFLSGNYSISNFLSDNGLDPNKRTIGVIDRDPIFNGASPLRDTKIEDLNELCRHLCTAGYQVVRLGSNRISKTDASIYGVLDYSFLPTKSQELEIELCRQLDLYIVWNTGFSWVPTVFNKPVYVISSPFLPVITNNTMNNPSSLTVGIDGISMNIIDLIYRTGEYEFENPNLAAKYKLSSSPIDFKNVVIDIDFLINKNALSEELAVKEKEYGLDLVKSLEWITRKKFAEGIKLDATFYASGLQKASNYIAPSFLKKYKT